MHTPDQPWPRGWIIVFVWNLLLFKESCDGRESDERTGTRVTRWIQLLIVRRMYSVC